jgi:hyaluronoglucosaminidase
VTKTLSTFQRRGIVEGFFGPLWTMAQRKRLFAFGAARGMNTYLYAPKDDPYHRKRWRIPYPPAQWRELTRLIRAAQKLQIDFVYGFHPGEGLCFSEDEPVHILLRKAERFYHAGVRTFAVLFDDIPSRLARARDRQAYGDSLARAEGAWLGKILARQPAAWRDVEWWTCPSYYSPDPLLARVFGAFEDDFLARLTAHLPSAIALMWTGPAVVAEKITLAHMRAMAKQLARPLILWDNYPVNDLSMADELHIGPLTGRDPRLPQAVYGYLNNPLLQQDLSFIPLATCFDYARNPLAYRPDRSWTQAIKSQYGASVLSHWRAIRQFADAARRVKHSRRPVVPSAQQRSNWSKALAYIGENRDRDWAREIEPWRKQMANWL